MNGGTTTEQKDSSSVTQIPQWMQNAGQQNYAYAQDVASQPLQQYQGAMVAGTAPQTQQAWDLAASSGNTGADQYNGATAGYLGALGQKPSNVTAGQLADTNLSPYMNPYTSQVIDTTMPIMQQANALSQNQQANAASGANAFGGSRQGVQQGVAQAQGAMNIGQMVAQLQSANFTQAQGAATNDINRRLTADQGNQTAAQAKINSDILASQGLTNTGDSMNKSNAQNFNNLMTAGASQSMQAQSEINANMAKFNEARAYPQQQLATLLSALGMTPHDTSTTGSQTTETTTPTDWAGILQKGLGTAANLWQASDEKVKKNVTAAGTDPVTGIPIKSFRYKGAPAGSPKVLGPLAQDVEKAAPGSTARIGGIMALPKPTLAAATPSIANHPAFAGKKFGGGALAARSALVNPRAGARAGMGLANTKRRPRVMGALG